MSNNRKRPSLFEPSDIIESSVIDRLFRQKQPVSRTTAYKQEDGSPILFSALNYDKNDQLAKSKMVTPKSPQYPDFPFHNGLNPFVPKPGSYMSGTGHGSEIHPMYISKAGSARPLNEAPYISSHTPKVTPSLSLPETLRAIGTNAVTGLVNIANPFNPMTRGSLQSPMQGTLNGGLTFGALGTLLGLGRHFYRSRFSDDYDPDNESLLKSIGLYGGIGTGIGSLLGYTQGTEFKNQLNAMNTLKNNQQ